MSTVLIFAGGDAPDVGLLQELPDSDVVVAADSGYDHAVGLGLRVDVLVGDMDSITSTPLPRHVVVERHPTDKDATDLELALDFVARDSPDRVVVVGGSGGRVDHELATAGLMCSSRWPSIDDLDWVSNRGWIYVIRERRIIHGDKGSSLSLVPLGGSARSVTTKGLKWELKGETIEAGSTRGVSNVMTGPTVDIAVEDGCLLAVVPLLV